ncbi:MAG: F0F1 ATP synthase subunit delta [Endozoicomonadaceae bacterium]|nr:F0F1 ATP synthase subunit delta [Endozoicomonadaceae bacterium]MBE8233188.1 F0F1 ATP synthase subunit delta [Endozoicomonadaceae bacterium]
MAKTTFARPYAKAAFSYAKENKALVRWETALCLASLVVQHQEAASILFSPTVLAEEKIDCLLAWINESISHDLKHFFELLYKNQRLALLPWIASEFSQMKTMDEHIQQVIVYSADIMNEMQQSLIAEKLAARFGQAVNIVNKIDPSLIGGVKISAGDWVYDDTLKARIDTLSRALIS